MLTINYIFAEEEKLVSCQSDDKWSSVTCGEVHGRAGADYSTISTYQHTSIKARVKMVLPLLVN